MVALAHALHWACACLHGTTLFAHVRVVAQLGCAWCAQTPGNRCLAQTRETAKRTRQKSVQTAASARHSATGRSTREAGTPPTRPGPTVTCTRTHYQRVGRLAAPPSLRGTTVKPPTWLLSAPKDQRWRCPSSSRRAPPRRPWVSSRAAPAVPSGLRCQNHGEVGPAEAAAPQRLRAPGGELVPVGRGLIVPHVAQTDVVGSRRIGPQTFLQAGHLLGMFV